MKSKIVEQSRFGFYCQFVWGPLLVIGFSVTPLFREQISSVVDGLSYFISLLAIVVCAGLVTLGTYLRRLAAANQELTNEVRLQNDRIWRLEDAVAELKGSRPRAD